MDLAGMLSRIIRKHQENKNSKCSVIFKQQCFRRKDNEETMQNKREKDENLPIKKRERKPFFGSVN